MEEEDILNYSHQSDNDSESNGNNSINQDNHHPNLPINNDEGENEDEDEDEEEYEDENPEYAHLNLDVNGFFEELERISKDPVDQRNYDSLKAFINTNENYLNLRLEGSTAFIYAVINEDLHLMEFLLDNGADVNDIYFGDDMRFEYSDYDLYSALHIAVKEGSTDTVKFLLEKKADPNIKREYTDTTPIFYAVHDIEILDLLINYGANINAVNADKWNLIASELIGVLCDDTITGTPEEDCELINFLVKNGFSTEEIMNLFFCCVHQCYRYPLKKLPKMAEIVLSNFFGREEIGKLPSKINLRSFKHLDDYKKVFDDTLKLIKKHRSEDDLKLFLLNSFSLNFDQSDKGGGIKSIFDEALKELCKFYKIDLTDLKINFDAASGETMLLYLAREKKEQLKVLEPVIIDIIKKAVINIETLNSKYKGTSILDYAIKYNQIGLIKELSRAGVKVDGDNLVGAVGRSIDLKNTNILEVLIDSGSNVDLNQKNKDGITPLLVVISDSGYEEQQIRLELAKLMLLNSVDKNKSTTIDPDLGEFCPIKQIEDRLKDPNEKNKEFYKELSKIVENCSGDGYGIVDYFCDFNQGQNVEQDFPEQKLLGKKTSSGGMIEFSDDEL